MPKVYLSEVDKLNDRFVRVYNARTALQKLKNYEVAAKTGVPLRTLYNRLDDPGGLRVHELRAIARATDMSRDEIADFILGNMKEVKAQ